MSLIPDLERTLVDAAVREPRRRRRALGRLIALPAGAAALIGALIALGVSAGSGTTQGR
ncbi:MAG: hypothetical protein H0T69_13800 [Thermoleophilaceae bacterium]|nr:hypothetical protein [Thermoleophilaceae bacterium]